LTFNILISWSPPSSYHSFGLPTLLIPSGLVLNIYISIIIHMHQETSIPLRNPQNMQMLNQWLDIWREILVVNVVLKKERCPIKTPKKAFNIILATELALKICPTTFYLYYYLLWEGWRSWLRHRATSQKVEGSIPDVVIGIFHWPNPSTLWPWVLLSL
jgi:hypothetical protein